MQKLQEGSSELQAVPREVESADDFLRATALRHRWVSHPPQTSRRINMKGRLCSAGVEMPGIEMRTCSALYGAGKAAYVSDWAWRNRVLRVSAWRTDLQQPAGAHWAAYARGAR